MLIEVKIPQLSESVAEATLVSWHKQVGEAVARDENLIDIETDKVVLELPAPNAGVITKILKGDGATVVSGEVVALIDSEGAVTTAAPAAAAPTTAAEAAPILWPEYAIPIGEFTVFDVTLRTSPSDLPAAFAIAAAVVRASATAFAIATSR